MSPEAYRIFVAVFTVWGVAVAIKAVRSLQTGQPYVFALWDGGMIRMGKQLSRFGVQIKVVVGVLMGAGCAALFAGVLPLQTGSYALVFVAMVSFVSDFVTAERT